MWGLQCLESCCLGSNPTSVFYQLCDHWASYLTLTCFRSSSEKWNNSSNYFIRFWESLNVFIDIKYFTHGMAHNKCELLLLVQTFSILLPHSGWCLDRSRTYHVHTRKPTRWSLSYQAGMPSPVPLVINPTISVRLSSAMSSFGDMSTPRDLPYFLCTVTLSYALIVN